MNKSTWNCFSAFLLIASFFLFHFFSNVSAAPLKNIPTKNPWHFYFAPYGWMSSLNGDVTIDGTSRHVYIPFREILKHLEFGAQFHTEVGRGPWTLMADVTYLKLSTDIDRGRLNTTMTSKMTLIDLGLFYRIFHKSAASFELLGGARYLGLHNTLVFNRIPVSLSGNTQLFSPIVGARFKYDFSAKTQGWLRGDVGGFHVDNVKKTWSATAGLVYKVNSFFEVGAAYKVLNIDFNKGNRETMNVLMHGPMLGFAFYS